MEFKISPPAEVGRIQHEYKYKDSNGNYLTGLFRRTNKMKYKKHLARYLVSAKYHYCLCG